MSDTSADVLRGYSHTPSHAATARALAKTYPLQLSTKTVHNFVDDSSLDAELRYGTAICVEMVTLSPVAYSR
jgi:hypothetical protein